VGAGGEGAGAVFFGASPPVRELAARTNPPTVGAGAGVGAWTTVGARGAPPYCVVTVGALGTRWIVGARTFGAITGAGFGAGGEMRGDTGGGG